MQFSLFARHFPVFLSPAEVVHFLGCILNIKHRTILTSCYAACLRISEAVHLKPIAIDKQRIVIRVERSKGRKDCYVMPSPKLLEVPSAYGWEARPKEWLFPGDIAGQPITRHSVEMACQAAWRRSGLSKPVRRILRATQRPPRLIVWDRHWRGLHDRNSSGAIHAGIQAGGQGPADLMIPAEVMIVEIVPLLGSGKLDFPAVTKMVRERGRYILPTPRVPNGLLGRIKGNGIRAT